MAADIVPARAGHRGVGGVALLQPVFTRWGEQQTESEEQALVQVLTEILLSLLAQNNVLLRGVVGSVFSEVCSQMTDPAIDSLLAVIKSKDGNPEQEDS